MNEIVMKNRLYCTARLIYLIKYKIDSGQHIHIDTKHTLVCTCEKQTINNIIMMIWAELYRVHHQKNALKINRVIFFVYNFLLKYIIFIKDYLLVPILFIITTHNLFYLTLIYIFNFYYQVLVGNFFIYIFN